VQFGIGQPVPRTEDPRLLTGNGHYVDDFNQVHQAYAVFLRSPHAHAVIKSIDTAAAKTLPGVLAVLTGADYQHDGMGFITGGAPLKRRDGSNMERPPRPALTRDRVHHVGQAVAVIVAETVAQAKDASELIKVDYAPLPVVIDTETANADGQPQIWDQCPGNEVFVREFGDRTATDAAFEKAAHVVRNRFVITRAHANTVEPRGALGIYHKGEDRYTIVAGHQRPWAWRTALTKHTFGGIPENALTLITGDVGGSFGMKGAIYPEVPLVGWASKRVGRPVKWTCERTEGLAADDHGRDNVTDAELALDEDGKFLAFRATTSANLGAYVSFLGFAPSISNVGGMVGPYDFPCAHAVVTGVVTNQSPISPYRGAGRPEASYVIERLIEIASKEVGIDAIELRRRNFVPPEAMPYKSALTFTYDCGEFEAAMDTAMQKADTAGFEARRKESEERGKLRGLGISVTVEQAAGPQPETAEIRFDPSGTATVLVGSTPHGQGHETIYKQLVSERLGLPFEEIGVVEGDTDKVSFGTGTGGSRTATIGTSAVYEGVNKVIDKAHSIAAHMLEAAIEDVTFENGEFAIAGTDRTLSFKQAAAAAFNPAQLPEGMEPGLHEIATYNPTKANFPNGCHICELEITPDTGEVEVLRYTVVDDVGTELNPLLVKGQIHGGIAMGLGQALMEEIVYDAESGQLMTGSFMDYCMPRADDMCAFEVEGRPVPTSTNPLGVKGAGECGTVGALAAVMNAVNDALEPLGVRHLEMPCTPERIWQAIRNAPAGA
jgi:carbon-monoxide dehydrogenase large subunit